jgi:hypothetical protein
VRSEASNSKRSWTRIWKLISGVQKIRESVSGQVGGWRLDLAMGRNFTVF